MREYLDTDVANPIRNRQAAPFDGETLWRLQE